METMGLIDIFLVIFIGMGPTKALLVYLGATAEAEKGLQRQVAKKAVVTAAVVALLLLVAGVVFMKLLHFTTGALTIAGGLILLLLAINMVLAPAKQEDHEGGLSEKELLSMAIYPMGIPLILNPVGIVALTVFSAETTDLLVFGAIVAMVFLVAALDFGVFLVSHGLDKYLTHERIIVLEKLLGILLAALAVQMVLNGLAELGIITMTGAH